MGRSRHLLMTRERMTRVTAIKIRVYGGTRNAGLKSKNKVLYLPGQEKNHMLQLEQATIFLCRPFLWLDLSPASPISHLRCFICLYTARGYTLTINNHQEFESNVRLICFNVTQCWPWPGGPAENVLLSALELKSGRGNPGTPVNCKCVWWRNMIADRDSAFIMAGGDA